MVIKNGSNLLVLFEGSIWFYMQVVQYQGNWSQREYHFRFVLFLSAKLYTKYVLLE